MATERGKGLRLTSDEDRSGLYVVEGWDEEYDFFEQLDLFMPGFNRHAAQQKLPLGQGRRSEDPEQA